MQHEVNLSADHAALRAPDAPDDESDLGRAEGLIDSLIKPLIAIDAQGAIQEITPVAAMLLKGQAEKFKGKHVSDLFPELEGADWAALAGLSTQARRADGSPMPVRLTVMRVITKYLDGWMIFVQPRKAPTL